jgi:phytoene/squalene synthetase
MKQIFDEISNLCSKITTTKYSTSFSSAISVLNPRLHQPIYNIYGFVRVADEIVDSFHGFDKKALLDRFEEDTFLAIEQKISTNPVLNSFQEVVNKYKIDHNLIITFLKSMRMDLDKKVYNKIEYKEYILGSAEVVGLMCLKVFVHGDEKAYNDLKEDAMSLGAAFQKVNFLRDLQADYKTLGRTYFPQVNMEDLDEKTRLEIEKDIEHDFNCALRGIRKLPADARFGVYLAYRYYRRLFDKIKKTPSSVLLKKRVRISNPSKMVLYVKTKFNYSFVGVL